MSKLDELIRELCPDGVEYKKLGEIATISRGGNFQKKDFLTEGVPCCLAWLGDEPVAVSGHSAIIHHDQNAKYLVYYFHSQMFFAQKRKLAHGTKVIEVTPDTLSNIVLPVPPIQVQNEIAKTLDYFTGLTAEITAQLTAELTARQKQYEFYRDKLLTFDVLRGGDN